MAETLKETDCLVEQHWFQKSEGICIYYFVSIETMVRPLMSVGLKRPQLSPMEVSRGQVVSTPRPSRRPFVVPRHAVLWLIKVMSPTVRAVYLRICTST